MKLIRDPLLIALFLFLANQGWCRLAASKDFEQLCKAQVQSMIHGESLFKSTQNFKVEPHLISSIEQTFIGLKATGAYELEAGAGARSYTCMCACGVFSPEVRIAIH